jgi:hypothetical protein
MRRPNKDAASTTHFHWRELWYAEGFGAIAATLTWIPLGILNLAAGNYAFALACLGIWIFLIFVYWLGWHLLLLGILKLRIRLGWVRTEPADPARMRVAATGDVVETASGRPTE